MLQGILEKLKLFPSRGAEPHLFSRLIHDKKKGFSDLLQSAQPNSPLRLLVLPLDLAILFCFAACNIRRNENYPAPGLLYQSWDSAKNPLGSGSNKDPPGMAVPLEPQGQAVPTDLLGPPNLLHKLLFGWERYKPSALGGVTGR